MIKDHHDETVNLVLLEYLAVRRCHHLFVDEGFASTTATTRIVGKATAAYKYRESLVRALNATIGETSRRRVVAWTSPCVVVVLGCLQQILETVFMDSCCYQLASSRKDDTMTAQKGTSPLRADRRGTNTNVNDQHVREAIRALGIQVGDWISASDVLGDDRRKRSWSSSSRLSLRLWRSLLQRHVARRVDILHRLQQQRGRSKPTRIRIRFADHAVTLLQRFVTSLLDPASVRLWNGNDGCQISFQSSCGAFHAHFFEFYEDDIDIDNDNIKQCEATPDENAAGGTWIGAVIDCPPPVTSPLPERRRVRLVQLRPMEVLEDVFDGNSTLASDLHYGDEYDSEMEDNVDDKPGGSSDQEEMSTASMTSSLSSTTSSSSSYSAGPTTRRFVSQEDGMDTLNFPLVPPDHHHRFRRLTLPAVLVATAKFSRRGERVPAWPT